MHSRHATYHLLKRGAIEFEHNRVADRDSARGARSTCKKCDFTNRLADVHFGHRNGLPLHSNLKATRHNKENCIGWRILQDECFAPEHMTTSGTRPDLCLLLERQHSS